jgi:acetylornithine deacetylase
VDDLTALLRDLVAIDSVNPDLVPGGAGETAIARFAAAWLSKAGAAVRLDEPVPGRPSVVGVFRGSGGGRSLLLNAHLDTVTVAGMERPHEPRIDGDRLYGRGAYDMKAGLAAIMWAGAAAARQHLRGDIIVTGVADEEYASLGATSLARQLRADAAIVTEATGDALDIAIAHKGFIWLEVVTEDVAAHGSRPELGVDAIASMGGVLVGLADLDRRLRAAPSHPLLGSGTVHASLISGGQELSSYPDRCVLQIERRTIPGETPETVAGEIQALLDTASAADPRVRATLRTTLVREPFAVEEDAPIVATLRGQAQAALGHAPRIVGVHFWADAAILAAAGIPTVIFGPGGAGAHAAEEWVSLPQTRQCADILVATIAELCA